MSQVTKWYCDICKKELDSNERGFTMVRRIVFTSNNEQGSCDAHVEACKECYEQLLNWVKK